MVISAYKMVYQSMKADWRYAITRHGEQSVMITGINKRVMWPADNWVLIELTMVSCVSCMSFVFVILVLSCSTRP